MQSYKANPTGDMQRVLVWEIAMFRNFIRDIVDGNNQVEESDSGKTSMPKARESSICRSPYDNDGVKGAW